MPYKYEVEPDDYLWSEGNYSCDCNRSLFFHDWNEPEKRECGDSEFSIRISDMTGKVIYSELE